MNVRITVIVSRHGVLGLSSHAITKCVIDQETLTRLMWTRIRPDVYREKGCSGLDIKLAHIIYPFVRCYEFDFA